jgi:hypothetical protein
VRTIRYLAALITAVTVGACATSSSSDGDSTSQDITAKKCDQALADRLPPATTSFIVPRATVVPFYQWEVNNGYCGEVSMMQAGLNAGQWTSQFNARLLCGAQGNGKDAPVGAPLLQSGPPGFCEAHKKTCDYNSQLLLEPSASATAATCLSNYRLGHEHYQDDAKNVGIDGYRHFMSWVKAQTIAGHQTTIGVLENEGKDSQYDHIVSVVKIGTNHSPTDPTYFDDDVLYFEDHGNFTFKNGKGTNYPSIPPGAGGDPAGCTPYVYGYAFSDLPKTRQEANVRNGNAYGILVPGVAKSATHGGGDGIGMGPPVTGHNYAFSVSGPEADADAGLLPVVLEITGTKTASAANPRDALAGFNYEAPHMGADDEGHACTNDPPAAFTDLTFKVAVSGLKKGTSYNLYEYDFAEVQGVGSAAALAVPTSGFNANASKATHTTHFVADGPTFTTTVTKHADQTVIFRAVPANAP